MKKVITKAVLDLETMQWVPSLEESHSYEGPWALAFLGLGGASDTENQDAAEEAGALKTLNQEQAVVFGENQQAQNLLNQAWDPILKGGAYQYGFSVPEDTLLSNQIRTEGAQQLTNTVNAAELRRQQATGGASAGPTGGSEALEDMSAQLEAQSTARALSEKTLAGYAAGRQLFGEATAVKQGIVSANNAPAYAGAAAETGKVSDEMNKTADAANANSLASKLVGGAIQGGLTAATGGLGGMMGGVGFKAGASTALTGY